MLMPFSIARGQWQSKICTLAFQLHWNLLKALCALASPCLFYLSNTRLQRLHFARMSPQRFLFVMKHCSEPASYEFHWIYCFVDDSLHFIQFLTLQRSVIENIICVYAFLSGCLRESDQYCSEFQYTSYFVPLYGQVFPVGDITNRGR